MQGLDLKSALISNRATSLCEWHGKHGARAKRDPENEGSLPDAKTELHLVKNESVIPDSNLSEWKPEHSKVELIEIPWNRLKPLEPSPRSYFGYEELVALSISLEKRQSEPLQVISNGDGTFFIVSGERRWRAAELLSPKPNLRAEVLPSFGEDERGKALTYEHAAMLNFQRMPYSAYEKVRIMHFLASGVLRRTVAELAETFGCSEESVRQHLAIAEKLSPEAFALMDPSRVESPRKKLQFVVALALTGFHAYPKDQKELAEQIVRKGMKAHEAEFLIERRAHRLGIKEGPGREQTPEEVLKSLGKNLRRLMRDTKRLRSLTPERRRALLAELPARLKEAFPRRFRRLAGRLTELEADLFRSVIQ